MKIAIMQPYLFPYLGYFQLISAVDIFVSYDDVQYRKGGFINRNKFLLKGKEHVFTFPVANASTFLNINQREFHLGFEVYREKFLKMIEMEYKRAPYYEQTRKMLEEILYSPETLVSKFNMNSIRQISKYLGIGTKIIDSSSIPIDPGLHGEARVILINKLLQSTNYINPIGGKELYSKESFQKEGIDLFFLKMEPITYKQFENEFVPNLSIIDVMMFNGKDQMKILLKEYELS